MNFNQVTQPIAEAIGITYDAPVDAILTADVDSDGVVFGQLMSGGNFYHYEADDEEVTTYYLPEETEYLNDYAHAVLDSVGIHTDSWDTYDYAQGFFRLDAQLKCKPGNKPCGKRCIPQGQKCRSAMGGAAKGVMRQGRANLRGAGKIAAGVVGAAALAAAGTAAYQNRGKIAKAAEGPSRQIAMASGIVSGVAKRKAAELQENVKQGVDEAKARIQEAAKKTGVEAKKAGKKATIAVKRVQKQVNKEVANARKGVEDMQAQGKQKAKKNATTQAQRMKYAQQMAGK